MKKKKEYNLFSKIRQSLRDIYRYSPMRRDAIKAVSKKLDNNETYFACPICKKDWPIQMAEVDHEPPLGPLCSLTSSEQDGLGNWAKRLFYGDVQVLCKICHKKKTTLQRSKKSNIKRRTHED